MIDITSLKPRTGCRIAEENKPGRRRREGTGSGSALSKKEFHQSGFSIWRGEELLGQRLAHRGAGGQRVVIGSLAADDALGEEVDVCVVAGLDRKSVV